MKITDAGVFERWWKYRDLPRDRRIVAEAEAAGLITRSACFLWLTEAGKRLRREGEALRLAARP